MAMLSFDYSRQFSITMYLGILRRLRGHSPVIKKGIAAPDLLLARLREFLRRILFVRLIRYRCTVNFHRDSTSTPAPFTLFITADDTSIRYHCN